MSNNNKDHIRGDAKMDHTDTEIVSYLGIKYVIVRIFSLLICCENEYQVKKLGICQQRQHSSL